MAAKRFFLDETKTDYIVISWDGYYRNVRISHNGYHLGGFSDIHELHRGFIFNLYDGSQLQIYLSSEINNAGLKINRNGIPIPGSSGDPKTKLRGVFALCVIFAIINIIIGGLAISDGLHAPAGKIDAAVIEIVSGVVVAVLGFITWRFFSIAALIASMMIIAGNIGFLIFHSLESSERLSTPALFYKVFVFITIIRGFRAIREYRHWQKPGGNIFPPPNPFQPQ